MHRHTTTLLLVLGEGQATGPWNEAIKQEKRRRQGDIKFEIEWTTLGEYLDHLVQRGISPNVASFVGATTVRMHVLGQEDRPPTPGELEGMRDLVRAAMEEGALGVSSSLIYAPAAYAARAGRPHDALPPARAPSGRTLLQVAPDADHPGGQTDRFRS